MTNFALHANNCQATMAASAWSIGTGLGVIGPITPTTWSKPWPTPIAGQFFRCTVYLGQPDANPPLSDPLEEIIQITAVSGSNWTVSARGLDNTTAQTHFASSGILTLELNPIAQDLGDIETAVNLRAAIGANSDITSLSGLTTPIPIGGGGTGATSSTTALANLGAAASGANTDITSLASPALGSATATTPAPGDNSPNVATTAFVAGAVTASGNNPSWKNHVRLATAGSLAAYTQTGSGATGTLTANANGALTVDGVAAAVGDSILVQNGASAVDDGIYTVSTTGDVSHVWTLVRRSDFTTATNAQAQTIVAVSEGSTLAGAQFALATTGVITPDTTSQTWTKVSSGNAISADESTLHYAAGVLSIISTYAGQTSIVTVGVVSTGTWQGTTIAILHGGTGATTAAGALGNLGAAANGANADVTSMTALTGPLKAPTQVQDTNGNAVLVFGHVTSAVNDITVTNAATNNAPSVAATGSDANIDLLLASKGTGYTSVSTRFVDTVSALVDGATVAVDASLGNVFTLSTAAARTLGAPSNPVAGQRIRVYVTNTDSASHLLTLTTGAGGYSDGNLTVVTTAPSTTDMLEFQYMTTPGKWLLTAYEQAYA